MCSPEALLIFLLMVMEADRFYIYGVSHKITSLPPGRTIDTFILSLSVLQSFPYALCYLVQFSSVQFSHSALSDSMWPHESQHARPPYPSPTPGVYSNSCPSSRWCHPAISSSVIPFSSCPQSLSASGSFPMSQLFTWGGQRFGVSASASVPSMNIL